MLNFNERRPAFLIVFCLMQVVILAAGCRQDMHDQPRYEPLEPSTFFEDGRSSRPPVEGTIARGQLKEDFQFYTGKTSQNNQPGAINATQAIGVMQGQPSVGNQSQASPIGTLVGADTTGDTSRQVAQAEQTYEGLVTAFPVPVTRELVDRGEERYNIYCAVCHHRTGNGLGMVVQRGYRQPPSLHIDRLRQAPVGYFFDVITNGFGAMPDYSAQVTPKDRWAIIAYIRALQLSQQGTVADVPQDQRDKLNGAQQQGGRQQ